MLLIATNKTDLACDYLILELQEREIPYLRMNTEDFGSKFSIDLHVGEGSSGFRLHPVDRTEVKSEDISAVYFRQIRPPAVTLVTDSDRIFARREASECLRSFWRLIPEEKWINHPRRLWLASNKIEQLTVAQSLGMSIPPTIVTVNKDVVASFLARHKGNAICKAVKHGFVHHGSFTTIATTQRIDENYLDKFEDFASVPMIYQPEIPKVYDIRVTVVGESVIAAAIHSQDYEETEVDWRVWDVCDFDLKHEIVEIPDDVSEGCRRLAAYYGLRYAAIDLVLSTDGRYFFLELNPNGQWAWIEQLTGYPIRASLIECMGYSR